MSTRRIERAEAQRAEPQRAEPQTEQLLDDYRSRIRRAMMPRRIRAEALRQLSRLAATSAESFEHFMIRGYLDAVIELPWLERRTAERRLASTAAMQTS